MYSSVPAVSYGAVGFLLYDRKTEVRLVYVIFEKSCACRRKKGDTALDFWPLKGSDGYIMGVRKIPKV